MIEYIPDSQLNTPTFVCVYVCVRLSLYLDSVGNKNDASPEKKVVKTEDAQKFAEQIGVPLYETSAKENQNVEEVSVGCAHLIHYS